MPLPAPDYFEEFSPMQLIIINDNNIVEAHMRRMRTLQVMIKFNQVCKLLSAPTAALPLYILQL